MGGKGYMWAKCLNVRREIMFIEVFVVKGSSCF